MPIDEDFSKFTYNSNSERYLTNSEIFFKKKKQFKNINMKKLKSYRANEFEKVKNLQRKY